MILVCPYLYLTLITENHRFVKICLKVTVSPLLVERDRFGGQDLSREFIFLRKLRAVESSEAFRLNVRFSSCCRSPACKYLLFLPTIHNQLFSLKRLNGFRWVLPGVNCSKNFWKPKELWDLTDLSDLVAESGEGWGMWLFGYDGYRKMVVLGMFIDM